MNSAQEEREEFEEFDLRTILRELFAWKRTLLGVTFLAGLLAAGYSLTIPNVYESSSALIVREPQRAIERENDVEQRPDPALLTVETLQSLTVSTEITWALFEVLYEKGAFDLVSEEVVGKQDLFLSFQGSLSSELKKTQTRGGSGGELLPILVLKTRATSPELAQNIANEWATLVVAKTSEIYTEGVEALGTYVGDMYTQSNDTLVELEGQLSEKELAASLPLKMARMKTLTDRITLLEDEILEMDIDIAVNDVAITDGGARIHELRVDNEWIGTVAEDSLLKGIAYPFSKEELSEQARKIVDHIEHKVRQTESLRKFRQEQNLLGKEKRFAHCQLDLERILEERARVDDELPALETAISVLTEQLEDIPETITLNKAITDDALWNLYAKDPAAMSKELPLLKSETLNPLYQSTRETIVDLTSKAETLRGSTLQLERSEKTAMALAEELESDIDMITEELDRRQDSLDATIATITFLRNDYLEEMKLVEELSLKNLRSIAERATRDDLREKLAKETTALEKSVADAELEIEVLTRETEKTMNVRTTLASKAEEVALLQVSAENATRTGTTIFYNAQANLVKVAPARRKMVLATMVLVLVGASFLICTAKLMQETEPSQ